MGEKKRFVKVEMLIGDQSMGYFISSWGNALGCIGDGEGLGEGEKYIITGVEMTQEELNALPDWEGW